MDQTHNTLPEQVRGQSGGLPDRNLAARFEDGTPADLLTEVHPGIDQPPSFVEAHRAPQQVERTEVMGMEAIQAVDTTRSTAGNGR